MVAESTPRRRECGASPCLGCGARGCSRVPSLALCPLKIPALVLLVFTAWCLVLGGGKGRHCVHDRGPDCDLRPLHGRLCVPRGPGCGCVQWWDLSGCFLFWEALLDGKEGVSL